MERIQCLVTRTVKGMRGSPYHDQFSILDIFSLDRRWLRRDLTLAYSIFHNCFDLVCVELVKAPIERDLRRNGFKLSHQRETAYLVRLPITWTKFPIEIINDPTLETFRRLLDAA